MITPRDFIAFTIGAAAGLAVSYFINRKYICEMNDLYNDMTEELEEYMENVDIRINPVGIDKEDKKALAEEYNFIVSDEDYSPENGEETNVYSKEIDTNEEDITSSEDSTDGEEDTVNNENCTDDKDSTDDDKNEAYDKITKPNYFELIDESRFSTEDGYVKRTFTYHEKDDIAINDLEQIVENFDLLYFSNDLQNWFNILECECRNDLNLDPDVLYLRDSEHDIDYEIIRLQSAFEGDDLFDKQE